MNLDELKAAFDRMEREAPQPNQEGEIKMEDVEVLASDCPPDLTCPKVTRAVSGRVVIVGR